LNIKNIIFEPVGTIVSFAPESLLVISKTLLGLGNQTNNGKARREHVIDASEIYWNTVRDARRTNADLPVNQKEIVAKLELNAAELATQCDDVAIALKELRELGITLHVASMLFNNSVAAMLDRFSLRPFFDQICGAAALTGEGSNPLKEIFARGNIRNSESIFLADHHFGRRIAFEANARFMLMMNDYERARIAVDDGCNMGISSLFELPLAVRIMNERK
jgi:phosphoglycolate phosphatase-like HAD superfamily hydrolase